MPVREQVDTRLDGRKVDRRLHTLLEIPPNFYAIAFGLVGLARVWRLAGSLYRLPAGIGDALFLVAAVVFLLFFVALVVKLVLAPKAVLADLTDSAIGPVFSLLPITWLLLGAIILNRLYFRPGLAAALIPMLAIVIVPPVIAGNAYFVLTGGRIDLLAYVLAGYAVLMALVQLRLVPIYFKLTFSPGFWSFTFSYAATAAYALRWIHLGKFAGAVILGYVVLAAITLFIGGIALRSLVALRQGKFLPAATVS